MKLQSTQLPWLRISMSFLTSIPINPEFTTVRNVAEGEILNAIQSIMLSLWLAMGVTMVLTIG